MSPFLHVHPLTRAENIVIVLEGFEGDARSPVVLQKDQAKPGLLPENSVRPFGTLAHVGFAGAIRSVGPSVRFTLLHGAYKKQRTNPSPEVLSKRKRGPLFRTA